MALWGTNDNANSAPKFITDAANAETGQQEYGSEVIFVYGNEGYPVNPGWARKTIRGSRTIWESLVSISRSGIQNLTLPYEPVLLIIGDSNARGSANATEQSAYNASYVVDPKMKVLNQANSFVTYTPGTITGLNSWTNIAQTGLETGFIESFKSKYPLNNLNIIKAAYAGSTITKGTSTGTITASATGNQLAITAGTVALQDLIVGSTTGIPTGTLIASSAGGNNYYVSQSGNPTGLNLTAASQTMTKYAATNSWSVTEGLMWNGQPTGYVNGYKNRITAGLNTLTTKKVVGVVYMLGTNDKSSTPDVYANYRTDSEALISAIKTTTGIANTVPIMVCRVTAGGAAANIQAQQAAMVAADPQLQLINMDGFALQSDATHFTINGYRAIGQEVFNRAIF